VGCRNTQQVGGRAPHHQTGPTVLLCRLSGGAVIERTMASFNPAASRCYIGSAHDHNHARGCLDAHETDGRPSHHHRPDAGRLSQIFGTEIALFSGANQPLQAGSVKAPWSTFNSMPSAVRTHSTLLASRPTTTPMLLSIWAHLTAPVTPTHTRTGHPAGSS
jgi:hypothetical protein